MISYVILAISLISLIVSLVLLIKISKISKPETSFNDSNRIIEVMKEIANGQQKLSEIYNNATTSKIDTISLTQNKQLDSINEKIFTLTKTNAEQLEKMIYALSSELDKINQRNEQKLEQMRATVDEKLSSTLESRLNKSFSIVSEQLEAVYKGLGEMKNLATGVGDLKNILTNVKTRGVFGEVQLGYMLEQVLASNQFSKNVCVKQNSQERVDYAILMPGKGNTTIFLPIDSKFPIEDYSKLCDAIDNRNNDDIQTYTKQLENQIKKEAKSISEKYINPPVTTDFAIMYLPIEGLYCEVIRNNGLVEMIQRDYKILICGPNTLNALLTSLQMGFRTLTIEKRSSEIWSMLNAFKNEFGVFVDLLTKTEKKINEAQSTIESATKKTAKIQKQLLKVEGIENDFIDNENLIEDTE